jgi:hypothetical protein
MSLIFAVDFDGTIADHMFPDIGKPVPGAFKWMKRLQASGAKLILWTMRSDLEGEPSAEFPDVPGGNYLTQAVEFCRANGVEFWGVNCNPEQHSWTQSPKVYAHRYIDDAAAGCPLKENPRAGGRPFVDWDAIGPELLIMLEDA